MHSPKAAQRGALMIEVLVTIVICVIGLWGLTQVQSKLQISEMESYQRSQALMLLDEIAGRIQINRANVASYVTGSSDPLGVGANCPTDTSSLAKSDAIAICTSRKGAAEKVGTTGVGAMLGARACIEDLLGDMYLITVAWQGMAPLTAPPSSVACGKNAFDETGTACVNDLCRRVVTTTVRIADLTP